MNHDVVTRCGGMQDRESLLTMKNLNTRKWSTPLIIGSGLVVAVSGVLMFFGLHNPIQLAHEWVGMVFAIAIGLHVLHHWGGFKKYFAQPMALSLVGSVALVSSAFIFLSFTDAGASPMMNIVMSIESSPVDEVAPLLNETPRSVVTRMEAAGFKVEGSADTILEIANANDREPRALMELLFSQKSS
ncbi:MAG: DUF4405 domain-containing protein [Candidatus Thiodiazotropha lotti]|uniref:DUF4405 domain-containing protein n=1 Tax=Candidatus Thiodiazotropha lotti TaxID=2792787 RepID=A0A9E4K3V8_9GAMM|nr:DUF4405 domain-containing protein [Candidatus Thiodiazotropha lotti]MCG7922243.1 DUF4405 domain-containing protein [Candidatus Thiodiazotropha lotti]MCG7931732.1 DUF4405 domain-containing protein [Candidatus Thiodiazotropha lotti]MCG7939111.1 DUF4405 domain-containing protein [Candidatus Thiodiazotropha lotti]MCG7986998.1 DUF4405 domain-containing protein [Candidatus Thiodiazotropha lotti]